MEVKRNTGEEELRRKVTEHFLKAVLCNSLSDFLTLTKIMEETSAIAEITPMDPIRKPHSA